MEHEKKIKLVKKMEKFCSEHFIKSFCKNCPRANYCVDNSRSWAFRKYKFEKGFKNEK